MKSATEDVKRNQKYSCLYVALYWIVGKISNDFSNIDKISTFRNTETNAIEFFFFENSERPPGGNMIGNCHQENG